MQERSVCHFYLNKSQGYRSFYHMTRLRLEFIRIVVEMDDYQFITFTKKVEDPFPWWEKSSQPKKEKIQIADVINGERAFKISLVQVNHLTKNEDHLLQTWMIEYYWEKYVLSSIPVHDTLCRNMIRRRYISAYCWRVRPLIDWDIHVNQPLWWVLNHPNCRKEHLWGTTRVRPCASDPVEKIVMLF